MAAIPSLLVATLGLLAKSRVTAVASVVNFLAAPGRRHAERRPPSDCAAPASLSLVIADTEPRLDRRVATAALNLGHDHEVHLLHEAAPGRRWSVLDFLVTSPRARLCYRALWLGWRQRRRIARTLGLDRRFSLTAGLPACWRSLDAAIGLRDRLRRRLRASPQVTGSLIANDLYCAAALIGLAEARGLRKVYDSHEFQIDRGRRKGLARIWIEYGLEAMVVAEVDEVLTVNAPLARLMQDLFAPRGPVRVVHNDHFETHPVAPSPAQASAPAPLLVFIGSGLSGRMLAEAGEGALAPFERALFYTGPAASLLAQATPGWQVRHCGDDYEPALLAAIAGRRAFVWCCLADECLSYRLATPNKFFQALALGLPIIASEGSYLAELCTRHGIGLVFRPGNADALAAGMETCDHAALATAMGQLRDAFRAGQAEI